MKKLSLRKLNLKKNDILENEHLKTVFGGYYGPYCALVAEGAVSSYEAEVYAQTGNCLTTEQYNYAYNHAYNLCMDY